VKNITVGPCPFGIAITPNGYFAYVTMACDNNISVIDTSTNIVVDTFPVGDFPLGIAIANINFPCPTPLDRVCIETTRIFDSCRFEVEKTIEFPTSNKSQDIQCEVIESKCCILDIAKIDTQQNLVDVKLQIKVSIRLTGKCFGGNGFKRVVCFDRNVTLISPQGAEVSCEINSATCGCNQVGVATKACCNNKLGCTVKVTATVKSKKLVQIQVPFLNSCESKQCSSNTGVKITPGSSYPLPTVPSQISRIMFVANTDPGMTSRVLVLLNGLPLTHATITEEVKPFNLELPGGPYSVENLSLKNLGTSSIYIRNLTIE